SRPSELDKIIEILLKYSLIRRNPTTKTLTIHRLLQVVLKDTMDKDMQRQWSERVVRVVSDVPIPVGKNETYESKKKDRSIAQIYLPHSQICASLIAKWH